ncbi:MAG: hypothetical protein VZS44_02840 [Bacilli bacterium]|nr:hypothetical protein [Bacilli bacterium]
MKKKLYLIYKRYKMAIISCIIVLLLCICGFSLYKLFTNSSLKEVNNELYAFKYDTTWKLKEKKDNKIVLKHKSGSTIDIQIIELTDEYRFSTIDELIDELLFNIKEQNDNYKLLSKKHDKMTKYQYSGYKILYENGKEQSMVNLYKKSDKLVYINYEAKNEYFDILLDSVHNIIYNLDVKDKKFDYKSKIKINTTNINYSSSDKLDKMIKDSKTYEIANNNYLVKYSIPSIFDEDGLNSKYGYYNFKLKNDTGPDSSISLSTSILNENIYEYVDKSESLNVFSSYSGYKKGGDYSNFKESIEKLDGKYNGFIYKNSYNYNNSMTWDKDFNVKKVKKPVENVVLIYALNNNHIFVIKIEGDDLAITKKLIDNIKFIKKSNYASYIKIEKEDNYLIGILKRFDSYKRDKMDYITIRVPDKYEEVDKERNIYEERIYGFNYDEDMDMYDYDVKYVLTDSKIDSIVDSINSTYIKSTYGKSQKIAKTGSIDLNGKKFDVYDGGYTELGGIMFTSNRTKYYISKKILFYNLPDDKGRFYIEISGNGKNITNDIVKELVNFTIEKKDYKK